MEHLQKGMEHLKQLEVELDVLSGCPRCNIEKPLGELRKWAELNPHKDCPLAGTGNDSIQYHQVNKLLQHVIDYNIDVGP